MSLDTDLGIDSIKRVEILSALQEQLPQAPVVNPEQLASLQTLQQIVEYMAGGDGAPATHPVAAADDGLLRQTLLQVVAEKTGYPVDMLSLDMSLDADLGIDSIKRVEILSALQEQLPQAPVVNPEQLASLQTLQQIVEYMQGAGAAAAPTPSPEPRTSIEITPSAGTIVRHIVELQPLGAAHPPVTFPDNAVIGIMDDGSGLAEHLCHALRRRQFDARTVSPTQTGDTSLAGLVILMPDHADSRIMESAFSFIRDQGPRLRLLAGITRLGGSFGLAGDNDFNPLGAGLAGIIKSADKEWPEVHCKVIDIPAGTISAELAEHITEAFLTRGPLEIGIDARGVCTPVLKPEALGQQGMNPCAAGETIIISGGARGVTAEVAIALAHSFAVNLLLLGRSPEPIPEPDWLQSLRDEHAIKQALAAHLTERPLTPRVLQQEYQRIRANREIQENITRIQAAGVNVRYVSADIRDAAAVHTAVTAARAELGPIAGFIHGAGVLADCFIVDKTDAQFHEVFSTKVDGLDALLQATAEDPLKLMVLFSSTSARFGRKGQADYAAANEVLNKTAQRQQHLRPACRVLSINWGPWDGGMVTPALKQLFADEGLDVIPLQAGTDWLVREIMGKGPVEVVATGSELPDSVYPHRDHGIDMTLAFERTLTLEGFPVLASHVMNGRAVLPLAIIAEWLAIGAMHNNPGLVYLGFDELRTLKGVILEHGTPVQLQIMAGGIMNDGDHHYVPVELRNGELLYAKARILLGDNYHQPPAVTTPPVTGAYPHAEIYGGERLFHGPLLQGITTVDTCSAAGISARVQCAPVPSEWVLQPIRSTWLGDPLVMDCAFQLMILWSFENSGAGSLPTCVSHYRQYQRAFPGDTVSISISIEQITKNSVTANIYFNGVDGQLLAAIEGYECVTDASLNQAFKRNRLQVPSAT
jgi:NAD(P)-dependent dehydrogenase (short-subunit alcohol dehydrogenase family)/acyl carrier protein